MRDLPQPDIVKNPTKGFSWRFEGFTGSGAALLATKRKPSI